MRKQPRAIAAEYVRHEELRIERRSARRPQGFACGEKRVSNGRSISLVSRFRPQVDRFDPAG
jgi:hypothetical protein